MEKGAVVGSVAEDCFSKANDNDSDVAVTFLETSAPTLMGAKNRTRSKDFRPRMALREKGNKGEEMRM